MKKLFLTFFILILFLFQKVYSGNKFDFNIEDENNFGIYVNPSPMLENIRFEADYNNLNSENENKSDLDLLNSLDSQSQDFEKNLNLENSGNFINKKNDIQNNKINEIKIEDDQNKLLNDQTSNEFEKLKIDNDFHSNNNKTDKGNDEKIDLKIENKNNDQLSNEKNLNIDLIKNDLNINLIQQEEKINEKKDFLDIDKDINKKNKINQQENQNNDNKEEEGILKQKNNIESLNSINLKGLDLNSNQEENQEIVDSNNEKNEIQINIPSLEIKENLEINNNDDDLNLKNRENLKIDKMKEGDVRNDKGNLDDNFNNIDALKIFENDESKDFEKKEENKLPSIENKIKTIFNKKDKEDEVAKKTEKKEKIKNNIMIIDNTNKPKNLNNKIIKTNSNKSKLSKSGNLIQKISTKKIKEDEIKNHELCLEPQIISLDEIDNNNDIYEKKLMNGKYDSEYENKIYEYNKKKIDVSKKYRLSDYKIKVNVPEFLKSYESTLGNGHLNHIYYRSDYINSLFAAILNQNLSAADSLLRIIKNTDIKNSQGETLLTYAAKNKKWKSIRYLILRGCNAKIPNKNGETMESILEKNGEKRNFLLLK
jgi:hypothetical protein